MGMRKETPHNGGTSEDRKMNEIIILRTKTAFCLFVSSHCNRMRLVKWKQGV